MFYKTFQAPKRVKIEKNFTVEMKLVLDSFVRIEKKIGDEIWVVASYINQYNELTYIALDEEVIDSYPISHEYIKQNEEALT